MLVDEEDTGNFSCELLRTPNEPTRLVILHVLQMGWTKIPGYLYAATENGRDFMQSLLDTSEGAICDAYTYTVQI
jgi:hypothetical protein